MSQDWTGSPIFQATSRLRPRYSAAYLLVRPSGTQSRVKRRNVQIPAPSGRRSLVPLRAPGRPPCRTGRFLKLGNLISSETGETTS